MKCPYCSKDISTQVRKATQATIAKHGAKGGSASGEAKRRNVDYALLAHKSHAARRAKKEAENG